MGIAMIDWEERIDELVLFLSREYRVEDRAAVEVLLAALIDCPRTPALWIVIETGWFQRECSPGWFAFGGHWVPESLPALRLLRPRWANRRIDAWIADERSHLAVEPDYHRLHRWHIRVDSPSLLTRTLRLRVPATSDGATRPIDLRASDARTQRLYALASDVLDDRASARPPDPPVWREPANFLYLVEIACRLGGRSPDYGQIAHALRALAVRRAWLLGRSQVDETDLAILARALNDSIPPWIMRLFRHLENAPDHRAPAETLQDVMRVEGPDNHELARLGGAQLLKYQRGHVWSLVPTHAPAVSLLIAGRAFSPAARPAAR
jgi:hypothetical protein